MEVVADYSEVDALMNCPNIEVFHTTEFVSPLGETKSLGEYFIYNCSTIGTCGSLRRTLSEDLSKRLQRVEEKIDSILKLLERRSSQNIGFDLLPIKVNTPESSSVNVYLLRLPDTLRLTMFAMIKLKEATTSEVSQETNRSRSVESIHLNQLERMGYIEKYRKGRKIFFKIPSPPK